MTAFGGLKTAFCRYSPTNAYQAYGLQNPERCIGGCSSSGGSSSSAGGSSFAL